METDCAGRAAVGATPEGGLAGGCTEGGEVWHCLRNDHARGLAGADIREGQGIGDDPARRGGDTPVIFVNLQINAKNWNCDRLRCAWRGLVEVAGVCFDHIREYIGGR